MLVALIGVIGLFFVFGGVRTIVNKKKSFEKESFILGNLSFLGEGIYLIILGGLMTVLAVSMALVVVLVKRGVLVP